MSYTTARRRNTNEEANRLYPEDRTAHEWYRFVLSYPPHLVRVYCEEFNLSSRARLLDPFCGTGTTIVEGKKLGIPSVGVEANPVAHFASSVKTNWQPDPEGLVGHAERVAELGLARLRADGIDDNPLQQRGDIATVALRALPDEQMQLLLTDSLSPLPMHKTLVLLDCLEELREEAYYDHERLALAKALVTVIGNLHFGPEVGVGPRKADALVIAPWVNLVRSIGSDLRYLKTLPDVDTYVHHADAREVAEHIAPKSIDCVITSPPYPNEKDYTRTTRLESVLLGFMQSKQELRLFKKGLVRSNTRNVYKGDDDDLWIANNQTIQQLAETIEARRIELGKTSGFERLYSRVTKLYFGGMARHLAELRPILKPGAMLAYVVGDQASYFRVMIRTGQLLAAIAADLGYEVVRIDLFRTRLATATKEQMREEVVVLRWPG